jgi:uncharacterized small protein (DUF1192 family)
MDEEEIILPKGSSLKLLQTEALEVHSIDALQARMIILQSELKRTEMAIDNKKKSLDVANNIFR